MKLILINWKTKKLVLKLMMRDIIINVTHLEKGIESTKSIINR